MYAYAGFPRSLNILGTLVKAIEQCQQNGFTPAAGELAKELDANTNKFDYGDQVQQRLIGAPFAIACAGGGFSYVGSIHESIPLAFRVK